MKRLLFVILVFVMVGGCEVADKPSDSVKVSGVAAMGELQSGTITIYDYNQCIKGAELAKVELENASGFEAFIDAKRSNSPMLLELSNFRYKEPFSDRVVEAGGASLFSVAVLSPDGDDQEVAVSFWTHLSAALTQEKWTLDGGKAIENINASNGLLSTLLTFDINKDAPLLINNFKSPSFTVRELAGARYGIANAAVASYMLDFDARNGDSAAHELYNSVAFASAAYEDLRFEGMLNGVGASGQIQIADVVLDANVYRTVLPNHMEAIINGMTGLPSDIEASFLIGVVKKIHQADGTDIFGFDDPQPLGDLSEPVLVAKKVFNCSAPIVGKCCGGLFKDSENVYGNQATVEFDVLDPESSYTVEVSNPGNAFIIANGDVPWRSGLKPQITFRHDNTGVTIPAMTVVFTNRFGKKLSVSSTINTQSCSIN